MSNAEDQARVQAWAERLRTKQRALVEESQPAAADEPEPKKKVVGAFDFDLLETNAPTGRGSQEDLPAESPVPPPGS